MKMICLVVMLTASAVAQEDYRTKAETCRQLSEDENLTVDEREAAALLAAKCRRLAAAHIARAVAEKKKEADEQAACVKELTDLGAAYRKGQITEAEFDRRADEILRKFTNEEVYEEHIRQQRTPPSNVTLHLKDGRRVVGRLISETTERIVLAIGDRYVAVRVDALKFIERNATTPPSKQSERRNHETPVRR